MRGARTQERINGKCENPEKNKMGNMCPITAFVLKKGIKVQRETYVKEGNIRGRKYVSKGRYVSKEGYTCPRRDIRVQGKRKRKGYVSGKNVWRGNRMLYPKGRHVSLGQSEEIRDNMERNKEGERKEE